MPIPLSERIDRLTRWLERRNERPLVGFTLGSYYPLHRYRHGSRRIPNGAVRPEDIHVADYLDEGDELFAAHEAAGGDFIFSAAPFWGLPWIEASLGCGVLADHAVGSTRSTPPPEFAQDPVVPEFSETNPWVAKMLEFIPALVERSAGRYPVGVTLMRGVADLLSALYGAGDFVLRMFDAPEEVTAVLGALTRYWIAFGRCLLERLPLFHGGTGSFLFSLWCPGKMIWTQEDAVALLSPALYEQFIYPADCQIARAFERTAMHLHPSRFIPIRQLMASQTDVIELHVDHDGPRAEALESHYRTALAGKPLLIWGDLTEADLDFVMTRLPHQGLAVNVVVPSVEAARQTWERAMRACRTAHAAGPAHPPSSRQRVLDALEHRQPDRVPIDFGSTAVTGVHVSCVAALRDYYGLEKRPVKIHEPYQMLGLLDEDLKQAMGIDVEGVFPRQTMFGFPAEKWKPWLMNGLHVLVPEKFNTTVDANGDTLIYPEGDLSAAPSARMPQGFYFFDAIIRQDHFDEDHLNPDDNLEEFTPLTEDDLTAFAADVREAAGTGRAVIANFGGTAFGDIALVPAPFLKDPRGIRDITEWYVSTRSRRDYIHQIFSKQCEIALANLARIHERIGNSIDAVFLCGTDFGTQTSSFCSVAAFRELWLPYYARVCGWIHRHTTWKCFKHSCGSVERFYPSFIEAGFDLVNPVQCSAAGMEPEGLKAKYGERLVFWGGGVDTQKTLPFGSPAEVREQVLRRCEVFAPGGGFVFNTIHNIQAGTPVENIVAMLDAVREFNGRS